MEDVPLLGVLRPRHCSEDRVLRPVRQRRRERGGGAKLPRRGQTSHHGALPGAGLHLQMGGEAVEPGTARTVCCRCFHSTNSPGRTLAAFLTGTFLYLFCLADFCFEKPSSAQFPADLGSSPEWCPAWVPRSRSRSAPCCACTCPSPSPSRAAARGAAETMGPSGPRPAQFLQVRRRPAPSFRTSRALLQPPVRPVSTHSWGDLLSRLIRLIPVLCFGRRVRTASLGAIRHCGPEGREGTLHRVHRSAAGRGHFHQSGIWLLELQTAK